MRLASFDDGRGTRIGLKSGAGLVDVARHLPGLPADMTALLALRPFPRAGLAALAARPPDLDLAAVRLLAPVPRPRKVLALGMNYADHVREMGREPPQYQVWFNKQVTAVSGPYDPVPVPAVSAEVDYEAELALVIGATARRVPQARAMEAVFGYMCANDVSVRDWQKRTPTWTLGKSFDGHAPMGPFLVSADEVPDPGNLAVRCLVDGEERQASRTSQFIFSLSAQIAYLSEAMTLEPGDVLLTGTPAGVAAGRTPPPWLKPGQRVRVEIEGLGALDNPVVAGDSAMTLD